MPVPRVFHRAVIAAAAALPVSAKADCKLRLRQHGVERGQPLPAGEVDHYVELACADAANRIRRPGQVNQYATVCSGNNLCSGKVLPGAEMDNPRVRKCRTEVLQGAG